MESGSTLLVSFASAFFSLQQHISYPGAGCGFIGAGSRCQAVHWPDSSLSDAVDLLHQHIFIVASLFNAPNPFQQYLTQSTLKAMILLLTARQNVGFIDDC